MGFKLLDDKYLKCDVIYDDFLADRIGSDTNHFKDEFVDLSIQKHMMFPIYMGELPHRSYQNFEEAVEKLGEHYLHLDREWILEGQFWHSLFLLQKRDYLLDKYPEIKTDRRKFYNIVMKKFDWENYVYKCVLTAQYVNDNVEDLVERKRYYGLIYNNMDVFNYLIKYEIFRNDVFILNVLDIIDENDISERMKAKVKDRPDLGKDPRTGRLIIYELNKAYPVLLSPMLSKKALEFYILDILNKYETGLL